MTMTLTDSLVTWVHLICASIWVGGSIFIGVVLVPVLKSHTKSIEELVALMVKVGRRFNKITVPAFGILMATGIYNSRGFIGDPGAMLETTYGTILLTKIILVFASDQLVCNLQVCAKVFCHSGSPVFRSALCKRKREDQHVCKERIDRGSYERAFQKTFSGFGSHRFGALAYFAYRITAHVWPKVRRRVYQD